MAGGQNDECLCSDPAEEYECRKHGHRANHDGACRGRCFQHVELCEERVAHWASQTGGPLSDAREIQMMALEIQRRREAEKRR